MTVEITEGNLLDADVEALVNPVNCVGVMGRGLALEFKRAFPAAFREYKRACAAGEVRPGHMHTVATGQHVGPRFVINFPTKRHWKNASQMEDIEAGLVALVAEVRRHGLQSIAVPPLGCGLGGLDWNDVRPRIERAFADVPDVRALVFAPAVQRR